MLKNGANKVKNILGDSPTYPGHLIVVTYQIMATFQSLDAAKDADLIALINKGLICSTSRDALKAIELLEIARTKSINDAIKMADNLWDQYNPLVSIEGFRRGRNQAERLLPDFKAKASEWLSGQSNEYQPIP